MGLRKGKKKNAQNPPAPGLPLPPLPGMPLPALSGLALRRPMWFTSKPLDAGGVLNLTFTFAQDYGNSKASQI